MRIVRLIVFGTLAALAGCNATKKVAASKLQPLDITKSAAPDAMQLNTTSFQKENTVQKNSASQNALLAFTTGSTGLQEKENEIPILQTTTETSQNDFNNMSASFETKQNNNIQSFAEVKQLAASKQLNLTNKQLKRIDKLDKQYHGDFKKFKDDAGGFFDTQTSKIIAAVGVVGLLLLIITGSGFGAFILILSVGALLLKWLHIISF